MSSPNTLRVATVQCDLASGDSTANLLHIERLIRRHATEADLFVLPEVFATGFAPDASTYGDSWESGQILPWLTQLSCELGIGIAGSYFTTEGEQTFNRFVLIDGTSVSYQDKRHLFSLGGEPDLIAPAKERNILEFRDWRIFPVVCYDLRFPIWCRCVDNEYDLLIAVASWPRGRRAVWQTLLRARAMENLAYCVGVNRIGTDAQGLSYTGDSVILSPRGEELALATPEAEDVSIATLDRKALTDLRTKFPVWQDADTFTIQL